MFLTRISKGEVFFKHRDHTRKRFGIVIMFRVKRFWVKSIKGSQKHVFQEVTQDLRNMGKNNPVLNYPE